MKHTTARFVKFESSFSLSAVEFVSQPIYVVDKDGVRHGFRKFSFLGHWGICSEHIDKVIVEAKREYAYAQILSDVRLLIAGAPSIGWDIYSLSGELLYTFPPMTLAKAKTILKKENQQNN